MTKTDHMAQGELFLIPRQTDGGIINQRATDGYVNATAICRLAGKQFADYHRLKTTKEFMDELSSDMGIPIPELIQTLSGGVPEIQGTWVHPQVAINLGQWASPKFAVLVSKWVSEWMSGRTTTTYAFPYHIRRYLVNRSKIPPTHFSMLDQMTIKLLGALESKGYIVPDHMMPDIALGKMFSKWLRERGDAPETFPSYEHAFDDGRRKPVQARLYPNELMTEFNQQLEEWVKDGRALIYFSERDPSSVLPLKEVYADLLLLAETTSTDAL